MTKHLGSEDGAAKAATVDRVNDKAHFNKADRELFQTVGPSKNRHPQCMQRGELRESEADETFDVSGAVH